LNLNLKEPLLPLLTGLFGASSLFISIKEKTKIPPQKTFSLKQIRISKKSLGKSVLASIIASPIPSFLPAMGSSQAALIGSQIFKELNEREFLFLLGAINVIVMGLSFITFYSIEKTRTGAAVAVSKLIPSMNFSEIIIILSAIFLSGIFAFTIGIAISKLVANQINKINYSKLSLIILIVVSVFVFIFSGFLGIFVFIVSAFTGIFAILMKVKRIHLMGCLLLPTILFYLL